MRTSTPLVLPSARKPAFKRRRVNHALDPGCHPGRTWMDDASVAPAFPSVALCQLSCATCHRALSTAIRAGGAGPSVCSRCTAATCAICARTCTSYLCPPSIPPTPALTRSPSPSTLATTPVSPKRGALCLSYAAMNCDVPVPSTKRKKAPIDKEDYPDAATYEGVWDGGESIVVPGCGRVVCRACCVESICSDGTLCVDCFALV